MYQIEFIRPYLNPKRKTITYPNLNQKKNEFLDIIPKPELKILGSTGFLGLGFGMVNVSDFSCFSCLGLGTVPNKIGILGSGLVEIPLPYPKPKKCW